MSQNWRCHYSWTATATSTLSRSQLGSKPRKSWRSLRRRFLMIPSWLRIVLGKSWRLRSKESAWAMFSGQVKAQRSSSLSLRSRTSPRLLGVAPLQMSMVSDACRCGLANWRRWWNFARLSCRSHWDHMLCHTPWRESQISQNWRCPYSWTATATSTLSWSQTWQQAKEKLKKFEKKVLEKLDLAQDCPPQIVEAVKQGKRLSYVFKASEGPQIEFNEQNFSRALRCCSRPDEKGVQCLSLWFGRVEEVVELASWQFGDAETIGIWRLCRHLQGHH